MTRRRRRRKEKIRDGCFFYFLPQCSYSGFLQGNNDDDEGEDEEEAEEAEVLRYRADLEAGEALVDILEEDMELTSVTLATT